MCTIMAASRKVPVVVILGATGTGKSKLAIELGRHFRGEIISADSMQMYKSLDIITNKVTAEEQAQCPHHLLNVLSPLSPNSTVVNFKNMALPIMDRLLSENKMPVIVGGTNYYIEALLWNFLIDKQTVELAQQAGMSTKAHGITSGEAEINKTADSSQLSAVCEAHNVQTSSGSPYTRSTSHQSERTLAEGDGGTSSSDSVSSDEEERGRDVFTNSGNLSQKQSSKARKEKEGKYAGVESTELYVLLQKIDPESAKRIHPKNRRKIVRALQVFDDHGLPMSQIHQAQHSRGNTPGLSGALRFPDTCVFWLQCQQTVLDERLDRRVDDMLHNGLVSELHDLHSQYLENVAAQNGEPDYTLGIFQSIGFKEFHDYLVLPVENRETPEGQELFQRGVEALKLATRQYARRQLKWIKNRFLKRPGIHVPAVYDLDSTDPSQWSHAVLQPAIDVISAVSTGGEVPVQSMTPDAEPATIHVHNVCQVCGDRVFTTLREWQAHLSGRKHKKMLQHRRNVEKRQNSGLTDATDKADQN